MHPHHTDIEYRHLRTRPSEAIPEPRRIPPSGEISPDGLRGWPTPTLTSRILVWGGMGVMAAAATAGAVLATRKVAGLIAGDDEHPVARPRQPRPSLAPMHAMPQRRDEGAPPRPQAPRRPRDSRNLADSITQTAENLSGSLNSVMTAVTGAIDGFRTVARQAGGIVEEFSAAADTVKTFLDDRAARVAPEYEPDAGRDPVRRTPRPHGADLGAQHPGTRGADQDRRAHTL